MPLGSHSAFLCPLLPFPLPRPLKSLAVGLCERGMREMK